VGNADEGGKTVETTAFDKCVEMDSLYINEELDIAYDDDDDDFDVFHDDDDEIIETDDERLWKMFLRQEGTVDVQKICSQNCHSYILWGNEKCN
jgi:hypothetical protein